MPCSSRRAHWFFQPGQAAVCPLHAGFGADGLAALGGQAADLGPCGEIKAQPHPQPVHRLPGIQVTAGAQAGKRDGAAAVQQVGGAARNMKNQCLAVKQVRACRGKQRGGNVPLLVGGAHQRNAPAPVQKQLLR